MKTYSFLFSFLILLSCQNTNHKQEPVNNSATTNTETVPPQEETVPSATDEASAKQMVSEANLQANNFKSILTQMMTINYQLKNYKEQPADKTNINAAINLANHNGKYSAALIDMSGVRILKRAFIKGTKPMSPGGDTYPRADIEAWECTSEAIAKEKVAALDQLKKDVPWDVISKSPITYWQDGHYVLILTPGGMYMLDEVPKIRKYLEDKM